MIKGVFYSPTLTTFSILLLLFSTGNTIYSTDGFFIDF